MKKPPLPKAGKDELTREVLRLLRERFTPSEALDFVLPFFTGWDLEAIIEELKSNA